MAAKSKILPKTFVYKGTKYYLLDVQYSKENAEFAIDIYGSRIREATYLIRHDTLDGKDFYGIYTTTKVSATPVKKKKAGGR